MSGELLLQIPVIGVEVSRFVALLLAAFAGGAFGAALGALPAFCFTGFMVIAGEAVNILTAELGSVGDIPAGDIAVGITGSVAFGPVFGPHVAFAGGAAAAAYAAKNDGMPDPADGDYHPAKDIAYALGTRPDILAVGGAFGIFGMLVARISGGLALPWDPIAMGVVLSAVVHRLAFGYPLIGKVRGSGVFDMTPFEGGKMRMEQVEGEEVATDGGYAAQRPAVEPWLPHQYKWAGVLMIGSVTGILAGWTAIITNSAFLAFGISAALLTFLNLGVEKIPVTHHMTLPASTAALAVMPLGMGEPVTLVVAAAFGVIGALAGEVVQRTFYAHSDTHFDPPAAAIVVATFVIAILAIVGVFPTSVWIPLP
ncbi:hypothetical protein KTS45_02345 [Halomicroarcula limicola]|uniref:DUF7973 domain-containing protein n=1 Tax=Haloarcula limicola TaxID=1429915 RepID=A0A8J7Y7D0_9EURY|nr:hypothetical protein [Halomicroarcula limicola]MBV0923028.1 hypothetical protein [Halomicroarcula limicola]